jgi:peptide-methionine (R)-S-oxide reductase
MRRRQFLLGSAGALTVAGGAATLWMARTTGPAAAAAEGKFEITRTEAEWRALLTPAQYSVLREEGTERAFTSPLNEEKRAGTFACAGCELPLYSSAAKYDSGTGWPSFWESLPGAVGLKEDRSFFMVRTECHCSRCGGHLGHVFDDGPPPTGKRHCINGVALSFTPAQA